MRALPSLLALLALSPIAQRPLLEAAGQAGACPDSRKIGHDLRITSGPDFSSDPSLAWSGSEFGIAWVESPISFSPGIIHFARLSPTGERVGPDIRLGSGGSPQVVSNGSGYGIAWVDSDPAVGRYSFRFARLDEDGNLLGETLLPSVEPFPNDPSLVWTGTEYGLGYLALDEYGHRAVFLARLDGSGSQIGDSQIFGGEDALGPLRVVWTGTEFAAMYGISTSNRGNPALFSSSTRGTRISAPGTDVSWYSLAWNGSEYSVGWKAFDQDGGLDGVFFTHLFSDAPWVRITEPAGEHPAGGHYPELRWAGAEYGLAWLDVQPWPSTARRILFTRLDAEGERLGEELKFTDDGATIALDPLSFEWAGSRYGAAWRDTRDGDSEIYFASIGCGCARADLPGNADDEDCDGVAACDPAGPWRNRGELVSCVTHECRLLVASGAATRQQCSVLLDKAEASPRAGGKPLSK